MNESSVSFIRRAAETPAFGEPAYQPIQYDDLIPDSLDIQERMALAVNGLTGPTDADKDHLIYFHADFSANPPARAASWHGRGAMPSWTLSRWARPWGGAAIPG